MAYKENYSNGARTGLFTLVIKQKKDHNVERATPHKNNG